MSMDGKIPNGVETLRKISIARVGCTNDLGVIIESQLSLSAYVTALCPSGYYQLRQLRPNIRSLTADTAKTLVQAFITCQLDYCNSLLYGVSNYLLQKVQSVQNAAGTRRCERIAPVLQKLHWLPARRRVEFKLECLVHQSLAGQTASYLASDIQFTSDTSRPQLRSASERICVVPRTRNSFGDRSFSAAGPRVWNALPPHLQEDMNYRHFKHALKGHMFRL